MSTRIIRLRVGDMTGPRRLLVVALLLVGSACARGDAEADRAPERPADQPTVESAEENPHAGHDMTAEVDSADEHADHATGGALPGAAAAVDPHAGHATAPTRPGAPTASDPHAAHAAVVPPRPGAATAPDPHAQHGTARAAAERGQVNDAASDTLAHDLLMELARGLVADPAVQRRIGADSALRALWADSSVRRHILGTELQEQR